MDDTMLNEIKSELDAVCAPAQYAQAYRERHTQKRPLVDFLRRKRNEH